MTEVDFVLQPSFESDLVSIRPLVKEDFVELFQVASDPLIWEQHQNKDRYTLEKFKIFFDEALESKGALIILDSKNGKVIGSSRLKIIDLTEGVVEIGWSFLSREYWGGQYNREFKKLMVNYALKSAKKVVFYVNNNNFRSQRALEKLGAFKIKDFDRSWVLSAEKGVTFVVDVVLK